MDTNGVQAAASGVILDRGVRYKLAEGEVTIRPLRFGTIILISQMVAQSGLTLQRIKADDQMQLMAEYGELMIRCVAAAELNDKDKLSDEQIAERAGFYRDNLTAFQVYELFVHVVNLSGIQAFNDTIGLLLNLKKRNLSPKRKGS